MSSKDLMNTLSQALSTKALLGNGGFSNKNQPFSVDFENSFGREFGREMARVQKRPLAEAVRPESVVRPDTGGKHLPARQDSAVHRSVERDQGSRIAERDVGRAVVRRDQGRPTTQSSNSQTSNSQSRVSDANHNVAQRRDSSDTPDNSNKTDSPATDQVSDSGSYNISTAARNERTSVTQGSDKSAAEVNAPGQLEAASAQLANVKATEGSSLLEAFDNLQALAQQLSKVLGNLQAHAEQNVEHSDTDSLAALTDQLKALSTQIGTLMADVTDKLQGQEALPTELQSLLDEFADVQTQLGSILGTVDGSKNLTSENVVRLAKLNSDVKSVLQGLGSQLQSRAANENSDPVAPLKTVELSDLKSMDTARAQTKESVSETVNPAMQGIDNGSKSAHLGNGSVSDTSRPVPLASVTNNVQDQAKPSIESAELGLEGDILEPGIDMALDGGEGDLDLMQRQLNKGSGDALQVIAKGDVPFEQKLKLTIDQLKQAVGEPVKGDSTSSSNTTNKSFLTQAVGHVAASSKAVFAQAQQAVQGMGKGVTAAMTQAFGRPGWAPEVGQRLMMMIGQNIQVAEIRLDPPDLGPMEVKVRMHQEQANVVFHTQQAQVREALEQAAPKLRELFEENGLTLGDVDVRDQAERQQDADSEQAEGDVALTDKQGEESEQDQSDVVVTQSDRIVDYYA